MRFWEVFALGWCQEIKVLAKTLLCLLSTVSDCTPTSIRSGRLDTLIHMRTHTYTHMLRNYLFLCEFDAFDYLCGQA